MINIKRLSVVLVLVCMATFAKAQQPDSVTTDELAKYAFVMDSIETVQKAMNEVVNKLAKGNQKITPERYRQLLVFAYEPQKLTEAKATPDEIAYIKKAMATRDAETLKFQNTFLELVNGYIGQKNFNKVRDAVANNPKVRARYEARRAEIRKK